MALSMTLYRSIYIFKDFPTPRNEREAIITYENEIQDYQPKNVRYIFEEVAHWENANQIHAWLLEHVQWGVDNCAMYRVTRYQLETLLGICTAVLKDPSLAPEFLPTMEKFHESHDGSTTRLFYGRTHYDEVYFNTVRYTVQALEEALADNRSATTSKGVAWGYPYDFVYRGSH